MAAGPGRRDSRATVSLDHSGAGCGECPILCSVSSLLSLFCPVWQWTQVPLLLPRGATSIPMHRAGPGRAELGAHRNQERKQQDLEGLGCQGFLPSSHRNALQREILLMHCAGTALSAGEAKTRVWGNLLLAGVQSYAGFSPQCGMSWLGAWMCGCSPH